MRRTAGPPIEPRAIDLQPVVPLIDYLIAVADVDALTGDLLARWGLALTER